MEVVKNVVREIAIIVLLAGFLEMLLPNSSMKRYVQVILGLFILISILHPLATLVSGAELGLQIEAWNYQPQGKDDFAEILAQGESLAQLRDELALREYQVRVEKQIQAMVQLVPGIEHSQVAVQLGSGNRGGWGKIQQVKVVIFDRPPENPPEPAERSGIEQVVIQLPEIELQEAEIAGEAELAGEKETAEQRIEQVTAMISNFYNLPASKITVEIQ